MGKPIGFDILLVAWAKSPSPGVGWRSGKGSPPPPSRPLLGLVAHLIGTLLSVDG